MVRLLRTTPQLSGKQKIIAGSALILTSVPIGAYYLSRPQTDTTRPSYDVVLPVQRSVDDLGGWKRVSKTDDEPVFAYSDQIDDVVISVSQQPIPEAFRGNVAGNVRELAEKGSYTNVIEAGGTVAYIGRSARGPQSVIFAKNNVLVFIKSQKTISNDDWTRYINSLVDPNSDQVPTF